MVDKNTQEEKEIKRGLYNSAQVTVLQRKLNVFLKDAKYNTIPEDGDFGPKTEAAVKAFQAYATQVPLRSTDQPGVADAATLEALDQWITRMHLNAAAKDSLNFPKDKFRTLNTSQGEQPNRDATVSLTAANQANPAPQAHRRDENNGSLPYIIYRGKVYDTQSSGFGKRPSIFKESHGGGVGDNAEANNSENTGTEFHKGTDIPAPLGAKIHIPFGGRVSRVEYNRHGFGNVVEITDGFYTYRYAHLSKFLVKLGDVVEAGDVIGEVGSTGNSTGPHLHYEVLFQDANGKLTAINPNSLSYSVSDIKLDPNDRYPVCNVNDKKNPTPRQPLPMDVRGWSR